MSWTVFVALFAFAFISAWTPGPNNTILMASGLNYGYRRTLPTVFGVALGFPLMIGIVGLGLGKIFEAYPAIYQAMKFAGAAYMLWLAYKIATSVYSADKSTEAKPFSFVQIALFQWINPKAWIMAVTSLSAYTTQSHYFFDVATVVAVFVFSGFTSSNGWALFGTSLRHVMSDPRYFRMINLGLAVALIASLVPLLWT